MCKKCVKSANFIVTNLMSLNVIVFLKKSQVWEITGAEFSKSEVHTAGGVSIRFPRFSRLRDDKSVQQATDLPQLLVINIDGILSDSIIGFISLSNIKLIISYN